MRRLLSRLLCRGLYDVPESMRPIPLSKEFTPFPLPRYDPRTGDFGPLKLADIPDIEAAKQRMADASTATEPPEEVEGSRPALSGAAWHTRSWQEREDKLDTVWLAASTTKGPAQRLLLHDEVDELPSETQRLPTTHEGTLIQGSSSLAAPGIPAISERHLQYVGSSEHPQLQLLRCMRQLEDVLDQYRSSANPTQSHVHVAALADLRASIESMPVDAFCCTMRAIRDTMPAGRGALYFPNFVDARRQDTEAYATDRVKLQAYLDFFAAVEARVGKVDEASGLPFVTVQPSAYVEAMATAAHIQLLDVKGALAPPHIDASRENLGRLMHARINLNQWPGHTLVASLALAIERHGRQQVLCRYAVDELCALFVSMVALCVPHVPLPSASARALIDEIVERLLEDRRSGPSHDPSLSGAVADVFLATVVANIMDARLRDLATRTFVSPASLVACSRSKPRVRLDDAEALYTTVRAAAQSAEDQMEADVAFIAVLKSLALSEEDVIGAAQRCRVSERVLHHLARSHPWPNAERRNWVNEFERDDGRGDIAAVRLAESLDGSLGSRSDGVPHGDAVSESARLRFWQPPPADADAGVEHLDLSGPSVKRFAEVMLAAPRDRYVESIFFHSDVAKGGPSVLMAEIERLINGHSLGVLTMTTLIALHELEKRAANDWERLRVAQCIQLLLFEIHVGRIHLASITDELQLQSTRGVATEASVIVDVASRVMERLVTAPPRFVIGPDDNPVRAFIDRELVMESQRFDGHGTSSSSATRSTAAARRELLLSMEETARFVTGGVASTKDRSSIYQDFRFYAPRRNSRWSAQPATSFYDMPYREPGRRMVLEGVARNATGTSMRYLGVFAANAQPPR